MTTIRQKQFIIHLNKNWARILDEYECNCGWKVMNFEALHEHIKTNCESKKQILAEPGRKLYKFLETRIYHFT